MARYFIFNSPNRPGDTHLHGAAGRRRDRHAEFHGRDAAGRSRRLTRSLFTGFTNLASVSWQQEFGPAGVEHQFDDITLELGTAAIPEPSSMVSGAIIGLIGLGYGWRRRTGP